MIMDPLFLVIVGAILFLLLLGLIGNWQLAGRIRELLHSLRHYADREQDWEKGAPRDPFIGEMIEEYHHQRLAGIEQINSQALIERHYNRITIRLLGIFPLAAGIWERFLSFLNASMVMLGLLGTFVGLTSALFNMQSVLSGFSGNIEGELTITHIVSAISEPFDGMSIAFITSICGIGASLILSLFTSGLFGRSLGPNTDHLKAELLTECEDFLDNRYLVYVENLKPKGSFEHLMERLANRLKESFDASIAAFADSILNMTGRIDQSVNGINQMVENQVKIVSHFDHGSAQLVKFGQTMEKTVGTMMENHHDMASQMERLGLQVDRLHESIHALAEKTLDSSRSLETLIRSSTQLVEDERKNNEKMVQLFSERWNGIAVSQKSLLEQMGSMQKQMEEASRHSASLVQQFGHELMQRTKEQWEEVRRDWQAQKEQQHRLDQEIQQQLMRQIEQLFQKMDQSVQQNNRGMLQSLHQSYSELSRLIRQLEEIGQKNMESQRFLIERLPAIPRSAEEFSRSIENLERLIADFLERFRREFATWMSEAQERERKYGSNSIDSGREIRELTRELEAVRNLLEREFHQSHRFSSEIQQLVEAIYETGRSSMRRIDAQVVEGRYPSSRVDKVYGENGRSRDEGYRR
jgi:hypothetical protein